MNEYIVYHAMLLYCYSYLCPQQFSVTFLFSEVVITWCAVCHLCVEVSSKLRHTCQCAVVQVYSIGPTFVERVMCRVVEQVAEEICRLFQCVPTFSATSAIQVQLVTHT